MGEKKQINYKFIPTSLFRGRPLIRGFPDEWATTKQACRDELVFVFFLPYILRSTNIKFHTLYIYIFIYVCWLWFKFIFGLMFFELVSILFAKTKFKPQHMYWYIYIFLIC